jgi:hypothetical protein
MSLPLPAFGKSLWNRRLLGARPRVACLLVGDDWRPPNWLPAEIPRLAVKNAAWHEAGAPRFDWRVVAACTVLAYDARLPGERAAGPDEWDSWLWLLADVQTFARDVLLFTPTIEIKDPADCFAIERDLEVYAWLNRKLDPVAGSWSWPPWWPHGDCFAPVMHARAA